MCSNAGCLKMQACQCLLVSISLTRDPLKGSIVSQTVLALRGSDGFSRDPWRCPGVCPRSLGARSCCKNRYLVTPTFAPLERNRGSRAQTHKNSMLFDSLLLRQDRCLSSSHLSCLNSRHLSCLNRRHLSCLDSRHLSI